MDLWIRSQNKIGNYKSDAQVIRRIGYEDKKEEFAILNNDNISELLGTYKTKERALEVLEDIDSFKEYMIMYEHQNEEYKDRIRLFLENKGHKLGTYYMPKE